MNFYKLPFFNKPHTIATTINKKFMKNVSVLSLALLSIFFSLICVAFIFFAGLGKFVSQSLIDNSDIRNLFIAIMHTFAALFAILYASFFIDKKRYDGKIVAPAITTVIIFTLTLLLTWVGFFSNTLLDIFVFVITADGVMISVFLLFLSILQYDIVSKKTSKRNLGSSFVRTLTIVSMILYIFSLFTYYDYFSHFLTLIAHTNLSINQTDALVLFLFIIADICLIVTTIIMYYIEHKLNIMLKDFTAKVRNKNHHR